MYKTIFATPDYDGTWFLTDSTGTPVQEGYKYPTKAEAQAACPQLWPTNSVWQGKRVRNGWRIKTD